jgi:hypothetical protein
MGPGSANELHVSLRQNECLGDILTRVDEIARRRLPGLERYGEA